MIEEKLKQLYALRVEKDEIEAEKTAVQEKIDALEVEIVDGFEARQIKSMKLEGLGNFVMAVTTGPKVVDQPLFRDWMEENGYPIDMVLAFNDKKFKGFYRELMDNNKPLPVGTECFTKAIIKITKGA